MCRSSLSVRRITIILIVILFVLTTVTISAQVVVVGDITLEWDDTSDNEDGFCIEHRINSSGRWSPLDSVDANVSVYGPVIFPPSDTCYFRVYAYNQYGNSGYSNVVSVIFNYPGPVDWVFNYPNPFNPNETSTVICYQLSQDATVSIKIYDVSNELVTTLEDGVERSKSVVNRCEWDGRNDNGDIVANNVYFCVIESSTGYINVRKIALLR